MMTLSCDRTVDLLPEYAAGTLDPARREALEAHLAACAGCRAEGDVVGAAFRSVPDVPAGLEARVLAAVRQRPLRTARWGTHRQLAAAATLAAAVIGGSLLYDALSPRGEPAGQTSPETVSDVALPVLEDPVSGSTLSDLTEAELEVLLARLES